MDSSSEMNAVERPTEQIELPYEVLNEQQAANRRNFIEACKIVSHNSFFNYKKRFRLKTIPKCINRTCGHNVVQLKPCSQSFETTFMTGHDSTSWFEKLSSLQIFIEEKHDMYFSSRILMEIVEFIMNVHTNKYHVSTKFNENSISTCLEKCRSLLSLHFNKFPTCASVSLRKTYIDFLMGPMDTKEKTYSTREKFGCNEGIARYCWIVLDNELKSNSPDGSLVDTANLVIPEEMRDSIRGRYWQENRLQIFETLPRIDRIDRIMLVLDTIIELLQIDLAIWHARNAPKFHLVYTPRFRPLIANILWPDNMLFTATTNEFVDIIMKVYADFVCLDYPKHHIDTIAKWVNLIAEMVYICEINSHTNYPNTGKYISTFASGIYTILKGLPNHYIIKVLQSLKPDYLTWNVGVAILKSKFRINEKCAVKIVLNFLNDSTWIMFKEYYNDHEKYKNIMKPTRRKLPKTLNKFFRTDFGKVRNNAQNNIAYPKRGSEKPDKEYTRREIIIIIYIIFAAYLESFQLFYILKHIKNPNDIPSCCCVHNGSSKDFFYVTHNFIKEYRDIYLSLKEFNSLLKRLKDDYLLAEHLKIFDNLVTYI